VTVLAVTVTFRLHEGRAEAFMPLLRDNARASVAREPGCLRFDLCIPEGGDGHEVFLYELYRDRADFDAHLASDHYRAFDEATRAMVASKRATLLRAEPNP
jgi:quinol monooxygenase YgiN